MIAAKLTHNAAQRINAFEITRVQTLIKAVKENFKPEGSGTYVNLQRRYMSLPRAKRGSAQALGAEIRKIHAEELLLDPACVTSEIERTFFFLHALGPEYESFRDHIFRQMDIVNDRDENGNITKAAPKFDYIENKAIEEEHRKGQLSNQSADANALPAFTLSQSLGDKEVTPSSDGKTCRIEINNVPFCIFCRKPYHREPQCFKKNPNLRDQEKERRTRRPRPNDAYKDFRKPSKRRASTDHEDDDSEGPRDPKRPTFMATQVSKQDINAAFGAEVEGNVATFGHIPSMMATKTLSIRDAWIVDSGCAQHVCNNASRFVKMDKYDGPPLRSVDTSTAPSGIGVANVLCNVRGRKKWPVLDDVLFVPTAHANLISVLQFLKRGAKIDFSSNGAIIRNKSDGKNLFTASQYHGVYALDLWAKPAFPAYHVSPQSALWHNRLAHMSGANIQRLKKQAHGIRDDTPRQPCNPCLQGRMIETPHRRSDACKRAKYAMELLHIDVAGPFEEGLDGSRYWLTIVDDHTGWVEIVPIPRRQEYVIESLRYFLDHNERPERKCRRIRLDRIPEQVGEEMKFTLFSRAIQAEVTGVDQHQQNGVAERAHKTIYDRVGPTLAHAKLLPKFWPEIARTAAFLSNRSPSSKRNMTPYQAWYGDKPDLSRLRVIGSKGEYLIPPKQRKKLTGPRTRPCLLLGYEGNTNYRILLEDGRIIGTPNAEFHEVLNTPSTQTREDVGAKQQSFPVATAAAAGGSETVGLINQPSASMRHASVPASGRQISLAPQGQTQPRSRDDIVQVHLPQSSDNNSQPAVAGQGDITFSPTRSDDTFGPLSPASQDSVLRIDSPPGSDQQQGDAQQGRIPDWLDCSELREGGAKHIVQQTSLERHPELKLRDTQTFQDTPGDDQEELILMNIPDKNVIPTFLTVAAEEIEPFEPKSLRQTKSDPRWLEWEKGMGEELQSLKQNKTWEMVDPPKDRRVLSGKWIFKLKRGPGGESFATSADG